MTGRVGQPWLDAWRLFIHHFTHLIELAMHQLYSVRDFGLMYLFSHALRNATSALHRCAFLGAVVRSVGASHSLFPLFVMWL